MHQYGLAVDMVLKIDGQWSWDDKGVRAKFWPRMHEIARQNGMTPIFNSRGQLIESPHIQLPGITVAQLMAGKYPDGGDEAWASRLTELIENWSGATKAPPKPQVEFERPSLDPSVVPDVIDMVVPQSIPGVVPPDNAVAEERFQRLHAFVKRWEGNFVNDPRDNGGATNMGITLATLSAWRGKEVSVADVRDLTRQEADAIFRANYYTLCRCGEMPERVAAVVYNGAVLHGSERSIKFLQTAFNGLGLALGGKPLKVDGDIGPNTMAAIRQTDPTSLASAYIDQQEAFFRKLDDFDHFGKGWLNRSSSLREFISTLPQGAGVRPKKDMAVAENLTDSGFDAVLAGSAESAGAKPEMTALLSAALAASGKDGQKVRDRLQVLLDVLDQNSLAPKGQKGKLPLTPVNAALGEGIGQMLDGKKSVMGVVGLLLTVLLPEIGLTGTIVDFVNGHSAELTTILATFTGWGFLGKIDKAIQRNKLRL
jgi:peptidoglycan L-alanyl-D-glutamate endopeptidase CwlK